MSFIMTRIHSPVMDLGMRKIIPVLAILGILLDFAGCGPQSGPQGKIISEVADLGQTEWYFETEKKPTAMTGPAGDTFILAQNIVVSPTASQVTGTVRDGQGNPLSGVKIVGKQKNPVKGYEEIRSVTGPDGTFRLANCFPNSDYALLAQIKDAASEIKMDIRTLAEGQILKLDSVVIRFFIFHEQVIYDSQTGLEWIVGPDRDMTYDQATSWIAGRTVAGGGWRIPTTGELVTLYQPGAGPRNMPPFFRTTGWWVWGQPRDSSSAWNFDFDYGQRSMSPRETSKGDRVFGVRQHKYN